MMSGDALVTDEYWAITGDTGQGTLMTFSPDPRKNEAAAAVVAEFEAQGYDPEGYTLYTYATIQVWAQAAEKAGTTDLDAVIEAAERQPVRDRARHHRLRRQGRRPPATTT